MAMKDNKRKPSPTDRFHNSDPSFEIHGIDSPASARTASDPFDDDLLTVLSDSRENRRARQVFEWETTRRNTVANAW